MKPENFATFRTAACDLNTQMRGKRVPRKIANPVMTRRQEARRMAEIPEEVHWKTCLEKVWAPRGATRKKTLVGSAAPG